VGAHAVVLFLQGVDCCCPLYDGRGVAGWVSVMFQLEDLALGGWVAVL
jgi:hypothetical protein